MNLFILRHGIAEECVLPDFDDANRKLTAKGRSRLKKITAAMRKMELSFDLILTSPYLRAAQTAQIVANELKLKKQLQTADELMPDGNVKKLIARVTKLKPAPRNLLLVGHEPCLSQLIALLVGGNDKAAIDLKKGGLGKLELKSLSFGRCATLAWLLTPKQMELMT